MSISVEEIAREFIRYGSKRLGIEDRLNRFTTYIKSRGTKCAETDVISHYVDSIFLPILSNSEQLAVAVSNKDVPRYYRNKFEKALNTRDKTFIKWFLKNYVVNYADADALVNQNYQLVPHVFGYTYNLCPIDGATCATGPSAPCVSIVDVQHTAICCTGDYYTGWGQLWLLVDNPPWKQTYMSYPFGGGPQVPTSAGTFTLTGSTTTPSCFPTSGVTMGFDVGVQASSYSSGTCTSSCPSGTSCLTEPTYCQCGGNTCYTRYPWLPVFYYDIGLIALPNTNYSVWWSVSVS
jgi:hypothetical protein